jgi:saccharopine dehydrogenase-like NADP-dependent oxidoreductase
MGLPKNAEYVRVDILKDPAGAKEVVRGADSCVVALPGSIASLVLPTVMEAATPTVDMSFTPEVFDPACDAVARRQGVPLVRDVGVAPGLSHIVAAAGAAQVGKLASITIYVGGLPQRPPPDPFRHAVYFNALDLLSEYTRPARMRRRGVDESPDPLDPNLREQLVDRDLGSLEAFPSDGLRTLLNSFPECPEMREMTLRWPGHLQEMSAMAKRGALDDGGPAPTAAAKTAATLSDRFPSARFPDYLLMEVHVTGERGSTSTRVLAKAAEGVSAMSRTTAFTATAAAAVLADRAFTEPGLHPPEALGHIPSIRDRILRDLEARSIAVEAAAGLRLAAPASGPRGVTGGNRPVKKSTR